MEMYLAVAVLRFLVSWLVLVLLGGGLGRCALAAGLGAVQAAACMTQELAVLGRPVFLGLTLWLMGLIAYGPGVSALGKTACFAALTLILGGISRGDRGIALGAGLGAVLVLLSRSGKSVEVELRHGTRRVLLTALRDTGNTLRDPVTGQSVLVADALCARTLLGLTAEQLRHPAETVASGAFPGLRLIPYRTVGRESGLLAALRLEDVRIGRKRGSCLVAFAPEGLGENGNYRALAGGMHCWGS